MFVCLVIEYVTQSGTDHAMDRSHVGGFIGRGGLWKEGRGGCEREEEEKGL